MIKFRNTRTNKYGNQEVNWEGKESNLVRGHKLQDQQIYLSKSWKNFEDKLNAELGQG